MKKIDKLNIEGKQSAWIGIILYSTVILVYVLIVGHILLRQILFNKIDISKIFETGGQEALNKVLKKMKKIDTSFEIKKLLNE